MREIRTSGSMSGERKRSDAERPKPPRLSSTLLKWSLSPLREKPVKVGAKVVRHGRYVVFQMADVRRAWDRKASKGALRQAEGWSRATVSSRDTSLHWPSTVGLEVKPVGEPDAGNTHVRFDARGGETGPRQAGMRRRRESAGHRHRKPTATAPLLDSTQPAGNPALRRPSP